LGRGSLDGGDSQESQDSQDPPGSLSRGPGSWEGVLGTLSGTPCFIEDSAFPRAKPKEFGHSAPNLGICRGFGLPKSRAGPENSPTVLGVLGSPGSPVRDTAFHRGFGLPKSKTRGIWPFPRQTSVFVEDSAFPRAGRGQKTPQRSWESWESWERGLPRPSWTPETPQRSWESWESWEVLAGPREFPRPRRGPGKLPHPLGSLGSLGRGSLECRVIRRPSSGPRRMSFGVVGGCCGERIGMLRPLCCFLFGARGQRKPKLPFLGHPVAKPHASTTTSSLPALYWATRRST
jgi:hypothetical protein